MLDRPVKPESERQPGAEPRFTRGVPETFRLPKPSREASQEHLGDYLGILHRHRWAAVAAFLAVFIPAALITAGATPEYEATTRLLLDPGGSVIASIPDPTRDANPKGRDYFETEFEILRSRALAERVTQNLKLWERPEYTGKEPKGFSIAGLVASAKNRLASLIGKSKKDEAVSQKPVPRSEAAARAAIIDAVKSQLLVEPVLNTRLVEVTFTSTNPQLASDLANSLTQAYIDQTLQRQSTETQGTSEYLADRLAEQRQKVSASDAALQEYRERRNAGSLEDRQNIVVAKLSELNSAVTKAKTDRIAKEGSYKQLLAIRNDRQALDGFGPILSNPFVQQLKSQLADLQRQEVSLAEQYGDQHPEMIRLRSTIRPTELRLQAEIDKLVQSLQSDYLAAETQEKSLAAALEEQKREAMNLSRMSIEYGALQREATSNHEIFDGLLRQTKQAGLSVDQSKSTVRVIDRAEVPRWPVRPKRVQSVLFALGGGLCFAIGLVTVLEYFDRRVRTPDQVVSALKIPFIACVPKTDSHPGLSNGIPSHFGEAFRRIRTKVLSASNGSRGFSIVVTSTGPREGKSVVAANLAASLAKAEQRVLLIDADLRRPTVHRTFDLPLQPGLSELLSGVKTSDRLVRPTKIAGLSIISAGGPPDNPSELLASSRFRTLLASLSSHFDWIVLDSPPVMAVADAAIVADEASSVLFVVAADFTREDAAKIALGELASAKRKLLGAVLNRVDFHHQSHYYSRYYRPEYESYYMTTRAPAEEHPQEIG